MTSHVSPRSRLYALLVAIDNYPPPVTPLKGCVNDLRKVASYLETESKDFEIHIRKIIDSEATKENLVKAFYTHFEPANTDDVILFYFSGHGTQEEADPLFWSGEQDHKLESLVCYDGYTLSEGQAKFRLLADKELRYIISKLADKGSHIVTIFDCCHSGGNTRNGFFAKSGDVLERRMICRERLSHAFPARSWKDFIFSETISLDDIKKRSIDQYLTEGKHIQLAACQNDESAFEVGGEGMFTKNLLEVLTRSEGSITYYDLQARVQNYLRSQFKQTPKAFVSGDNESSLFLGFLNKKGEGKPQYGNINFNETDGWVIDLGSMHGLSSKSVITVFDSDTKQTYSAKLNEVYPTHSQLQFENNDKLDKLVTYKGHSTDYFFVTLNIYINVQDLAIKQELQKILSSDLSTPLTIAEAPEHADYCIEAQKKNIFISRPEMPGVPIVQPVEYSPGNSAVIIRNYLGHLSQFEFVKQLLNPNSFLFNKFPVEIFFYQKDAMQREESVPLTGGDVVLNFVKDSNGKPLSTIRIKLKNTSDRKLYCALIYLTFNFAVHVKLLKEVVMGLGPNQEGWALDGASISLTLEDEIVAYNYRESASTLKIMVSTSDFTQQAVRFEMPPLPGPLEPGHKGLAISPNNYMPDVQDWITRNIDVKIKNPGFTP